MIAVFFALSPLSGCAKILGDFSKTAEGEDAGGIVSADDATMGVSSDDGATTGDDSPDGVTVTVVDSSAEATPDSSPDSSGIPDGISGGMGLPLGQPCTNSSDCLSAACSDGVCCQTRCVESCKSCNYAGSVGICANLPAGMQPAAGHATCVTEAQSGCGQNGTCDGMGQCALWNNVVCKAGGCDAISNTATGDSKCNGQGACVSPKPLTCAPYLCNAGTGGCYGTCTTSAQCVAPTPCVSSSCGPKANGATCSSGSDCASMNCVDGYCCDTACSGQCEACDLTATLGTCSAVTSGQPHGMRTACGGTAPCGGSCTAASRATCTFTANTVSCRAQSCTGSTLTAAAGCNGAGACPAVSTSPCPGNLICNTMGTGCLTSCGTSTDCANGGTCSGGMCGSAGQANGTSCSSGTQCQSAICVDNYCCNSGCSGQCQACDVAGSLGTCSAVTSGQPHGSRAACSGSGMCQGTCSTGSQTACSYPTTQCSAQSCTSGTVVSASNCNGGTCPSGTTTTCGGGFGCNGASCATSCDTSNDTGCMSGLYCNSGGSSCLSTLPNGRMCTSASSCTSGYCVSGYCCNVPCTGGCANGCSATPGTCSALAAGTNSGACGNYLCEGATTCPTSCTTASQCVSTAPYCNMSPPNVCSNISCFVAGTPVETETGLRAIETIAAGDRVRSFDTATGQPSWREVRKLERRVAPQLVAVSVGASTIHVSPEHYFWVTASGWVRARDLLLGDRLISSGAKGPPAVVSALASLATQAGGVAVYNLVVEGFDDYFVSETPVLVHSCDFLGFSSVSRSELPQ